MADAPKRIWIEETMGGWIALDFQPRWRNAPEYVRADDAATLATAQAEEIERLRKNAREEELKAATGTLGEAMKDLRRAGMTDAADLIERITLPETERILGETP